MAEPGILESDWKPWERPKNETAEDLAIERAAAERLSRRWGLQIRKLSPFLYTYDWAIFKPSERHPEKLLLAGIAEYKRRERPQSYYPTTMLSAAKWLRMRHDAETLQVPFMFVVEWDDCIAYRKWGCHTGHGYQIVYGGNARDQMGDLEPVIMVPNEIGPHAWRLLRPDDDGPATGAPARRDSDRSAHA